MSQFTTDYCDTNCGCDAWWFDFVAQMAHWLGAFGTTVGMVMIFGRWFTLWWLPAVLAYASAKEFWWDMKFENDNISGGFEGGWTDWSYYIAGYILAVIIIAFSKLPGSMMPWPPRCAICCDKQCCGPDPDEKCASDKEEAAFSRCKRILNTEHTRKHELERTGLLHS